MEEDPEATNPLAGDRGATDRGAAGRGATDRGATDRGAAGGRGRRSGLGTSNRDRGSISAFVALMVVALMALLGLVVDGGRAMAAHQAAMDEAEQAARSGAGAVSTSALRSGSLVLDPSAAVTSADAFTVAAGHPGTAKASGDSVTVSVHYRMATTVLGMVGISSLPVSATATAVDVEGVTSGAP